MLITSQHLCFDPRCIHTACAVVLVVNMKRYMLCIIYIYMYICICVYVYMYVSIYTCYYASRGRRRLSGGECKGRRTLQLVVASPTSKTKWSNAV